LLSLLGQALGLQRPPRRVDVFDNSHTVGTNAVGAMIVAGMPGFMKQHYRTFNIRSEELTPGDDYGMMREVLRRRFYRLLKEAPRTPPPHPEERSSERVSEDGPLAAPFQTPLAAAPQGEDAETFPARPDLVLIDGGVGPVRRRALLQSFGTAKAISRATLADLEKVPGINAATARLVYDYFHERR